MKQRCFASTSWNLARSQISVESVREPRSRKVCLEQGTDRGERLRRTFQGSAPAPSPVRAAAWKVGAGGDTSPISSPGLALPNELRLPNELPNARRRRAPRRIGVSRARCYPSAHRQEEKMRATWSNAAFPAVSTFPPMQAARSVVRHRRQQCRRRSDRVHSYVTTDKSGPIASMMPRRPKRSRVAERNGIRSAPSTRSGARPLFLPLAAAGGERGQAAPASTSGRG